MNHHQEHKLDERSLLTGATDDIKSFSLPIRVGADNIFAQLGYRIASLILVTERELLKCCMGAWWRKTGWHHSDRSPVYGYSRHWLLLPQRNFGM